MGIWCYVPTILNLETVALNKIIAGPCSANAQSAVMTTKTTIGHGGIQPICVPSDLAICSSFAADAHAPSLHPHGSPQASIWKLTEHGIVAFDWASWRRPV